jgi:hypothetical protein
MGDRSPLRASPDASRVLQGRLPPNPSQPAPGSPFGVSDGVDQLLGAPGGGVDGGAGPAAADARSPDAGNGSSPLRVQFDGQFRAVEIPPSVSGESKQELGERELQAEDFVNSPIARHDKRKGLQSSPVHDPESKLSAPPRLQATDSPEHVAIDINDAHPDVIKKPDDEEPDNKDVHVHVIEIRPPQGRKGESKEGDPSGSPDADPSGVHDRKIPLQAPESDQPLQPVRDSAGPAESKQWIDPLRGRFLSPKQQEEDVDAVRQQKLRQEVAKLVADLTQTVQKELETRTGIPPLRRQALRIALAAAAGAAKGFTGTLLGQYARSAVLCLLAFLAESKEGGPWAVLGAGGGTMLVAAATGVSQHAMNFFLDAVGVPQEGNWGRLRHALSWVPIVAIGGGPLLAAWGSVPAGAALAAELTSRLAYVVVRDIFNVLISPVMPVLESKKNVGEFTEQELRKLDLRTQFLAVPGYTVAMGFNIDGVGDKIQNRINDNKNINAEDAAKARGGPSFSGRMGQAHGGVLMNAASEAFDDMQGPLLQSLVTIAMGGHVVLRHGSLANFWDQLRDGTAWQRFKTLGGTRLHVNAVLSAVIGSIAQKPSLQKPIKKLGWHIYSAIGGGVAGAFEVIFPQTLSRGAKAQAVDRMRRLFGKEGPFATYTAITSHVPSEQEALIRDEKGLPMVGSPLLVCGTRCVLKTSSDDAGRHLETLEVPTADFDALVTALQTANIPVKGLTKAALPPAGVSLVVVGDDDLLHLRRAGLVKLVLPADSPLEGIRDAEVASRYIPGSCFHVGEVLCMIQKLEISASHEARHYTVIASAEIPGHRSVGAVVKTEDGVRHSYLEYRISEKDLDLLEISPVVTQAEWNLKKGQQLPVQGIDCTVQARWIPYEVDQPVPLIAITSPVQVAALTAIARRGNTLPAHLVADNGNRREEAWLYVLPEAEFLDVARPADDKGRSPGAASVPPKDRYPVKREFFVGGEQFVVEEVNPRGIHLRGGYRQLPNKRVPGYEQARGDLKSAGAQPHYYHYRVPIDDLPKLAAAEDAEPLDSSSSSSSSSAGRSGWAFGAQVALRDKPGLNFTLGRQGSAGHWELQSFNDYTDQGLQLSGTTHDAVTGQVSYFYDAHEDDLQLPQPGADGKESKEGKGSAG